MSTLLFRFCNGHLTVAAVEMKSKALTVVEEEKGTGILSLVVAWTDAELISDAVARAHKLSR